MSFETFIQTELLRANFTKEFFDRLRAVVKFPLVIHERSLLFGLIRALIAVEESFNTFW
jgi:hypothetical protein